MLADRDDGQTWVERDIAVRGRLDADDRVKRVVERAIRLGPIGRIADDVEELVDREEESGHPRLARIVGGVPIKVFVDPDAQLDPGDLEVQGTVLARVEDFSLIRRNTVDTEREHVAVGGAFDLNGLRIIGGDENIVHPIALGVGGHHRGGDHGRIREVDADDHAFAGRLAVVRDLTRIAPWIRRDRGRAENGGGDTECETGRDNQRRGRAEYRVHRTPPRIKSPIQRRPAGCAAAVSKSLHPAAQDIPYSVPLLNQSVTSPEHRLTAPRGLYTIQVESTGPHAGRF